MNRAEIGLDRAVATLLAGFPLIFPTDTVYGLGVAVGIAASPEVLYDIKERDHGKPVAWLIANPEALNFYAEAPPTYALVLARTFWPGPLTLVVRATKMVGGSFCSTDGTIALRMPKNDIALKLIMRTGVPLATTSANISGNVAPSRFDELDPRLLQRVPAALRDNTEKSGVASTVVDCTGAIPGIIREGDISYSDIEALL